MGLEIVGKSAGTIGKLLVGSAKSGPVGSSVYDGFRMRLDCCGAWKKRGGGEGVEVMSMLVCFC